jgi:hypothetical protein
MGISGRSRRDFLAAGLALPVLPALRSRADGPAAVGPARALPRRQLGRTGIEVTTLGMGCMITSDPTVIERALDLGVNFFDTARVYQGGNNERMVGAALGARRKDVLLCTKTPKGSKAEALSDLETSLKELGTDHVDIWHLHGKSSAEQISDELMEAQQIARQQGKMRFAGVSTHGGHAAVFKTVLANKKHFDVILTSYNFAMDSEMETLVREAREAGIAIVGMKVMAGGFRRRKPGDKIYDTLSRAGAMPAALRWVLKDPHVDTTIPSMTDREQLEENHAAALAPFVESDAELLAAQYEYIRTVYCRACGRCDGRCAQDLPVADILRHMSYAEGYGDFRLARESYHELPEKVVNASCRACPVCTVDCPFGVKVAERVARAQEWLA